MDYPTHYPGQVYCIAQVSVIWNTAPHHLRTAFADWEIEEEGCGITIDFEEGTYSLFNLDPDKYKDELLNTHQFLTDEGFELE